MKTNSPSPAGAGGELNLDGQLIVQLIDGYVPSDGDSFDIFHFGRVTGVSSSSIFHRCRFHSHCGGWLPQSGTHQHPRATHTAVSIAGQHGADVTPAALGKIALAKHSAGVATPAGPMSHQRSNCSLGRYPTKGRFRGRKRGWRVPLQAFCT